MLGNLHIFPTSPDLPSFATQAYLCYRPARGGRDHPDCFDLSTVSVRLSVCLPINLRLSVYTVIVGEPVLFKRERSEVVGHAPPFFPVVSVLSVLSF